MNVQGGPGARRPRVAVVGGGISGLAAAWELQRLGADVHLLESADRAGGVMGSIRRDGYTFELGPSTIQKVQPEFLEFCRELGVQDDLVYASPAARDRYLYYHGLLQPLPKSFKGFLQSRLFTPRQKLRVLMEPLIRRAPADHEETVAEFFGRRIGRGITMTWIDVLVSGVYGGNPNRLGVNSAFPELKAMEQEHGSIFSAMKARARERRARGGDGPAMAGFQGGLQRMVDAITDELGERVLLRREVRGREPRNGGGFVLHAEGPAGSETWEGDRVVLAVPARTAGLLMGGLCPNAADLLFEVEYVSMVVAHAGFHEDELPELPVGFGYLVPRCTRMRTLGWIFSSMIFPHLAPEHRVALTGFVGGALDPHVVDESDESVRHFMLGELALALGKRKIPRPEVFQLVRWLTAIPQYNVGHLKRMEAVCRLLRDAAPGIEVAGNWVAGVSVDRCIARGRKAAKEVLGMEAAPSPEGVV